MNLLMETAVSLFNELKKQATIIMSPSKRVNFMLQIVRENGLNIVFKYRGQISDIL